MQDAVRISSKKPARFFRRMSSEPYTQSLGELRGGFTRDGNAYSAVQSIVLHDNVVGSAPEIDQKPFAPGSLHLITPINSQISLATSPSSHGITLNRKLTKGYAKFLDEKEFINKREEERVKIQRDLKRTMDSGNDKIISEDVRKLIIATMVNKKKPRSCSRKAPELEQDQMNKYEEKHKQVCSRILGEAYENNLLFMKTHEDQLLAETPKIHTGNRTPNVRNIFKSNEFSNSDLKKGARQLMHSNMERRANKTPTGESFIRNTGLARNRPKENERPRLVLHNDSDFRFPVLSMIKADTNKKVENIASINEMLEDDRVTFSHIKLSSNDIEGTTKLRKKLRSPQTLNNLDPNSHGELRVKNISRRNTVFTTDLSIGNPHNEKKVLYQNTRRGRKDQLSAKENGDSRNGLSSAAQSLTTINGGKKESISKINELCHKAMKSTSKLNFKMNKQHNNTEKELNKLGTRIEKLTFDNTIENWEKSLKQVMKPLSTKFIN